MISVGIIGGTGYTGKELLKICSDHKKINKITVYGASTAGSMLFDIFPELQNIIANSEVKSVNDISDEHDVYFTALPHGETLKYVPALIAKGKKVIDLGGDFRLGNVDDYKKWYKFDHTSPELLTKKVYGLADYYSNVDEKTELVANPGCYPTSVLLATLPIIENFADAIDSITSVSYSGTSGAGKSAKPEMLMSEMHGNVRAYNVNAHRHQPEIYQEMQNNGYKGPFSFTTHLLPVAVGIYSTSVLHLNRTIDEMEVIKCYDERYANSEFVRMRKTPPNILWVKGTNFCDINVSVNDKTIVITSTIDNLIKGAAGQAIQNMNKMFGWDAKLGITKKED